MYYFTLHCVIKLTRDQTEVQMNPKTAPSDREHRVGRGVGGSKKKRKRGVVIKRQRVNGFCSCVSVCLFC